MFDRNRIKRKGQVRAVACERGANFLEYAILCTLIAVIALAAVDIFGFAVSQQFSLVGSSVAG